MSYDEEDVYDRIQDQRIEQAHLPSQREPQAQPRTVEASLLSVGDLIVIPAYALTAGVIWGQTATVARTFPFEGGATVDLVLSDDREIQLPLYDSSGVVLLAAAGTRVEPYPRWTGAQA